MKALKLTEAEIEQELEKIEGWKREDGKWLVKKYRFPTFPEGILFVNGVAEASERLNHHPFISIDYKMVTLRMTTWRSGGLTELDFQAAAAFDLAYMRNGA
ncbi:4a-hydroxytetrahydrobiopterin dehydratase [Candidatus Pristimantibacillus sp. PTI5]|uniref:4a-hydroxytetrahydrobiopterin dehydratase n=1 Tax=Candidatus Pristimantibacillus sp. PTI5 TaxID=3400422 RepID=UPI003B01492D